MGLDNRVPFPEGQSIQFLSGFIYPVENQVIKLPDGTLVTGRCEIPAQCKTSKGIRRDDIKKEEDCTGQCHHKDNNVDNCGATPVPCPGEPMDPALNIKNKGECTDADGLWLEFQWSEATIATEFDDRHLCQNDNEQNEWISYVASKYVESSFLPSEEWRRQAGFRWEQLGTISADGWFIPTSMQFRRPTSACVKQSCTGGNSTGDEKGKSKCEDAGGTFETKLLRGQCTDQVGEADNTNQDDEDGGKAKCIEAGNNWSSSADPEKCEEQGGLHTSRHWRYL